MKTLKKHAIQTCRTQTIKSVLKRHKSNYKQVINKHQQQIKTLEKHAIQTCKTTTITALWNETNYYKQAINKHHKNKQKRLTTRHTNL